jgi:hypothetical protein
VDLNKLVHDRIPQVIASTGKQYLIRTLGEEEFIKVITAKGILPPSPCFLPLFAKDFTKLR